VCQAPFQGVGPSREQKQTALVGVTSYWRAREANLPVMGQVVASAREQDAEGRPPVLGAVVCACEQGRQGQDS